VCVLTSSISLSLSIYIYNLHKLHV
jgi:hypothetical protein